MHKTDYFFAYDLYDPLANLDNSVSASGGSVSSVDSSMTAGEVLLALIRTTEDKYLEARCLPATRRGRLNVIPTAFNKV